MGTPSYMPPEQARGETDRIDERADVFALGSILCEVLTAKPAFTGRGATEILRKAADGATADAVARLDGCGSEAELIGLAKDCLAVEPEGRPRDANVVAERITAYLSGVQERVQAAERERAVAVARAVEERRRRKVQLALAASVLALTTLSGLSTTYYLQQRQARAAAGQRVVDQVTTLHNQAVAQPDDIQRWEVALAAVEQADPAGEADTKTRLLTLRTEIQDGLDAARRDKALLDRLVDIRSAESDDHQGSGPDVDYADAFRAAGIDLAHLSPAEAGAKIKARSPSVTLALAGALDDWAMRRRHQGAAGAAQLSAAARVADPDPWRTELRNALDEPERAARLTALKALAKKANFDELGPISLHLLGTGLSAAGDGTLAETVLRRAQERHPRDVWVNFELAGVLQKLARRDEAIRFYTAARALRPETAHMLAHALAESGKGEEAVAVFRDLERLRPDDGRHLECLGESLQSRGRAAEARDVLARALAVQRGWIRNHPDDAKAHTTLGRSLQALGRLEEAIVEYRTVIRLWPGHSHAHANLGLALAVQGNLDAAIPEFREAIRLQPDDAVSHSNLGKALHDRGKVDESVAEWSEAIRLKPDFCLAHLNLGNAFKDQGKLDEAIAEYRTTIRLQPDDADAHNNLGIALARQGKADAATSEFRETMRLKPDHAGSRYNLGTALKQQGKLDEAIAEYRTAIRLWPEYAAAHYELGNTLKDQGKQDEAIAEYRTAIRLQPDHAEAHCNLGIFLQQQGAYTEGLEMLRKGHELGSRMPDWQYPSERWVAEAERNLALAKQGKPTEAITKHRTAIRPQPDDAQAHCDLGQALSQQGKLDEAIAEFRAAIRLQPDLALVHYTLGNTLKDQGKLDEAIAEYRTAIRLQPDLAEAHCNLGIFLQQQGAYAEGLAMLRKGHDLGSKRPDWQYPSAQWVAEAERALAAAQTKTAGAPVQSLKLGDPAPNSSKELEDRAKTGLEQEVANFRNQIGLRPDDGGLYSNYGRLLGNLGRHDEAIEACKKAIKLNPNDGGAHYNLGNSLAAQGQLRDALAAFGEAQRLDQSLCESRQWQLLYHAARAAARAAAGKGKDEPPFDDAAKVKLRQQALDWLRAEYKTWDQLFQSGAPQARRSIADALLHWKQDPDLADIRDDEALARLPAAKRKEWQALWADVGSLESRAATPIPTETKTSRTGPLE
jgi:tetratricopeptide (TPR) repeat protein